MACVVIGVSVRCTGIEVCILVYKDDVWCASKRICTMKDKRCEVVGRVLVKTIGK